MATVTSHVVAGLDLSLSSTGVATITGSTSTVKPRPATLRGGARLDYMVPLIVAGVAGAALVVIEDYSPGSVGISGKLANAELRGAVLLELARLPEPPAIGLVRPSTLKRWATGNGAAKKPAMIAAAVTAGWTGDPKRDDEADAWHLRAMARQWITGDGPPDQVAIADGVAWPTS